DRRQRRRRKVLVGAAAALAVVLFAVGGIAGYAAWRLGQFDRLDVAVAASDPGQPENYLIVGSDSRDEVDAEDADAGALINGDVSGKRSDTMIVLRVDPQAQHLDLLSIPRDLWVPIAGAGKEGRINGSFAGGPQRVIDTVQQSFGVPINHYVEVDFRAFKGVVDALGGVAVYFDQALRDEYTGLSISEPGCVQLDGEQALAFVRSRHLEVREGRRWVADPTGDLGRISRQQLFLRRAVDKASGLGLGDLATLNRLAGVATKNIVFDDQLDLRRSTALARRFASLEGDAIATYTLPTKNFRGPHGEAAQQVDKAAAEPILELFRGAQAAKAPVPLRADQVSVQVLNGSGVAGQARRLADQLGAAGFSVAGVGDSKSARSSRTVIRYAPELRDAADLVARHLSAPPHLVEDPKGGAAVVVVTGRDPIDAGAGASGGSTASPGSTAAPPPTSEAVGVVPDAALDAAAACR
ncbi:MAG: LCP family protein, partial [Acidimicrobiales bacterium]